LNSIVLTNVHNWEVQFQAVRALELCIPNQAVLHYKGIFVL